MEQDSQVEFLVVGGGEGERKEWMLHLGQQRERDLVRAFR